MTHKYGNFGNDVAICRVGNIPEHGTSMHIKVVICRFIVLVMHLQ